MRILTMVALLLVIEASSSAVLAQQDSNDGSKLLIGCRGALTLLDNTGRANMQDAMFCIGFVAGFRDGHDIAAGISPKNKPVFCASPAVTNGQLVRVLVRWLDANPAKLHERAGFLVGLAFLDAFPC